MATFAEKVMADPPQQLAGWELELVRRALAAGQFGALPREPVVWPEPVPTRAEDLARLEYVPPPRQAVPARTFEEEAAVRLALENRHQADMARRRALADLSAQVRSQLESDRRFSDPAEPYWRCHVEAVGGVGDSGCFPLLVRAASAEQAADRYSDLMGLTGGHKAALGNERGQRQQLAVVPYAEPAA